MRKACLQQVYELARKDDRVVFIGSDLGHGVLASFRKEMPQRFIMEGICEANAVGMAAGLAMDGRICYVNTIATFLTRRCFEQIVLDACLHQAPIRLIGNGGGFVYAPLGPTHLATEDMAILRAVPNMTIVAPADADEMCRLMPLTVEHPGPIYIRLARGYDPIVSSDESPFEIGKAILMAEGSDGLIVTTGVCLQMALQAAEDMGSKGLSPAVLHMHTVKPLDVACLLTLAASVPCVVTVEEHSIVGGLGGAVAEVLAEADFQPKPLFRRIGIPDVFPEGYGRQQDLLDTYGITAEAITNVVCSLLDQSGA